MLLTGNEIVARAAYDSGCRLMFGYPISPSSEIIPSFQKLAGVEFLQTEDEIAAGFAVCGAALAGKLAFTASAGMGHVLMQDALSMAEAMRLPFVLVAMQRSGPSTGQVSYAQQETILATHGGNGEGLRIVYSPSNPRELYYYTYKTFAATWKYKFPAILLSDGYLGKAKTKTLVFDRNVHPLKIKPILEIDKIKNLRNCFGTEEEMAEVLEKNIAEYEKVRQEIEECQTIDLANAKLVVVAAGIVGAAAKAALEILGDKKVGLFRPITLRPFPKSAFRRLVPNKAKIMVVESANGQLAQVLASEVNGTKVDYHLYKSALGITPEEIIKKISQITD